MHTVLVTVDTPGESLDVELPAEAPLCVLLPALLDLCGLPPSPGAADGAWALGLEGIGPLPAARSLAECEVVDGMRLRLQDGRAWSAGRAAARPPARAAGAGKSAGGIGVRWRREGLLPDS